MAAKTASTVRLESPRGVFPALFSVCPSEGAERVQIDPYQLPWSDLRRAAKLAFPGGAWVSNAKRHQIVRALNSGEVPGASPAASGPVPTGLPVEGASEEARESASGIAQEAPTSPNGADGLEEVKRLLGIGAVNAEQVRAEIDKALAPIKRELQQTVATNVQTIEVRQPGGAEPIKLARVHEAFREALSWVELGVPVILWGPEGTGKSTLQAQLAEAAGVTADRQFWYPPLTCDNERADILGFERVDGTYSGCPAYSAIKSAAESGEPSAIIVEEIDGGNENTSVALNQIAENGHVSFPNGETVTKPGNVVMIASANTPGFGPTAGFSGRQRLDRATRSRFVMVFVGIDEKLETALVRDWAESTFKAHEVSEEDRTARREAIAVALANIRAWRRKSDEIGFSDATLSPRASMYSARGIAAGQDPQSVTDSVCWSGIDPQTKVRVVG